MKNLYDNMDFPNNMKKIILILIFIVLILFIIALIVDTKDIIVNRKKKKYNNLQFGCKYLKYGCCPDRITPSLGPYNTNCVSNDYIIFNNDREVLEMDGKVW